MFLVNVLGMFTTDVIYFKTKGYCYLHQAKLLLKENSKEPKAPRRARTVNCLMPQPKIGSLR